MAGQKDVVIPREIITASTVVFDKDGNPMSRVVAQASELIGLPKYSNVTVGPLMLEGWCADSPEAREAKLKELNDQVWGMLGQVRAEVLDILKEVGLD